MADVLRFNPFGDDPRDRNNMVLWMQKTLNKISSQSLDGDELAEIEELNDKLEILDNFLISNSDKSEEAFKNNANEKVAEESNANSNDGSDGNSNYNSNENPESYSGLKKFRQNN